MRAYFLLLFSMFSLLCVGRASTQDAAPAEGAPEESQKRDLFSRVIENQKKNDAAMENYERIERIEMRKLSGETQLSDIKIYRVVPAGTGLDRIPLGPDQKPVDATAYHSELLKLEKALAWSSQSGRSQHEAFERVAKKKKDRDELIDAARSAFIFTYLGKETRGSRTLSRYKMEPNRAYKPTSRSTSIYTKVRGTVWIDDASAQLARVEGEVTEDISLGLFLARVNKGSHFMQERYPVAPGLWFPTYTQYDFDGRKFFVNFTLHERNTYGNYRYVGPPKEALAVIRAELGKPVAVSEDR